MEILYIFLTSFVGLIMLGCGMIGYFYKKAHKWLRISLFIAGLLIIYPVIFLNVLGFILVSFLFFYQYKQGPEKNVELSIT